MAKAKGKPVARLVLQGEAELQAELKKLSMLSPDKLDAVVSYNTKYAIIVHEDLSMRHKPGKVAKYLEIPFRRYRRELIRQVIDWFQRTQSLRLALTRAGLFLQRESQKIVPVDTGALKASATTRIVKRGAK